MRLGRWGLEGARVAHEHVGLMARQDVRGAVPGLLVDSPRVF